MCYEDSGTSQTSYEVTFDNAETYVTDQTVLDDFNDNVKTAWQDFSFPVGPYAHIAEQHAQVKFTVQPVGQLILSAITKTARTFDVGEGERGAFSVDLVTGLGADSFAFFFFFQAEDGIRDVAVTGVQTCALPICGQSQAEGVDGKPGHPSRLLVQDHGEHGPPRHGDDRQEAHPEETDAEGVGRAHRSEERRVGKECRARRSPDQGQKVQETSI